MCSVPTAYKGDGTVDGGTGRGMMAGTQHPDITKRTAKIYCLELMKGELETRACYWQ